MFMPMLYDSGAISVAFFLEFEFVSARCTLDILHYHKHRLKPSTKGILSNCIFSGQHRGVSRFSCFQAVLITQENVS